MNYKTIFLVIIFSILLGFLIFWFTQNISLTPLGWKAKSESRISPINPITQIFTSASSSPINTPTPSINSSTNLEDAAKNLTPKDFSPDFQKLKEETNNF